MLPIWRENKGLQRSQSFWKKERKSDRNFFWNPFVMTSHATLHRVVASTALSARYDCPKREHRLPWAHALTPLSVRNDSLERGQFLPWERALTALSARKDCPWARATTALERAQWLPLSARDDCLERVGWLPWARAMTAVSAANDFLTTQEDYIGHDITLRRIDHPCFIKKSLKLDNDIGLTLAVIVFFFQSF